ncbi:MAG: segregation/condensation protein A [Candidatus Doudnabacteria bacterium]|nr:segregation/condensation protein A [Candidatus Doudnabacteria bacterium]
MRVQINQFEGPLDLLLQLIEDQQMDITALSLGHVTEQFLEYVRNLQEKNPINIADFLIIAAKLLVIKSKALLPNLEFGIEEEETAYDLAQQLLIYKKFKEVAKYLRRLDLSRHQSWAHEVDFTNRVTFVPDPDVTVPMLAESLGRLATELREIIKLPEKVMEEVVSISEKIAHIQRLIADKVETSLSDLLREAKSKTDIIVTFLALLELTKQRIVSLEQTEHFADIIIKQSNPISNEVRDLGVSTETSR